MGKKFVFLFGELKIWPQTSFSFLRGLSLEVFFFFGNLMEVFLDGRKGKRERG